MTTATHQSGDIPHWTLSDRLRKAREVAGLTQSELAEAIGVSKRTITSAERGEHMVRKIVLNAWSLATGVPVTWLAYGDPGPGCHGDGLCAIRDSNPEPADYWPHHDWVMPVHPNEWIILDYPRSGISA